MKAPEFVDRVLQRLGLGEPLAPGLSGSPDTFDVGGYTLPKDFRRIIDEGQILQSFMAHAGYRILLDRIETECNKRLAELKEKRYADPALVKAYLNRWSDGEDMLTFIQETLINSIQHFDALKAELGDDLDKVEEMLEDMAERRELQKVLQQEAANRSKSENIINSNLIGNRGRNQPRPTAAVAGGNNFNWDQDDEGEE